MLTIRLQRTGRTNDPSFRIIAAEKARAAKTGRVVELLGNYNPRTKAFAVNVEHVKDRIAHGAQLSPTLHNLFLAKGIIAGKKINVLPKKTVPKKEAEAPVAAASAASEAVAEVAPLAEAPAAPEAVAEVAPAPEVAAEEAAPETAEASAEA